MSECKFSRHWNGLVPGHVSARVNDRTEPRCPQKWRHIAQAPASNEAPGNRAAHRRENPIVVVRSHDERLHEMPAITQTLHQFIDIPASINDGDAGLDRLVVGGKVKFRRMHRNATYAQGFFHGVDYELVPASRSPKCSKQQDD